MIHQIIPGRKTDKDDKDVGHFIDTMNRFRPALLFLTEVSPEQVKRVAPPDYTLIQGTLPGEANIRVCLIKVTQQYEIIKVNCDIPTVAVMILEWTFLGVYREWRFGGGDGLRPRTEEI